jgi:maltose-binding protein MalE
MKDVVLDYPRRIAALQVLLFSLLLFIYASACSTDFNRTSSPTPTGELDASPQAAPSLTIEPAQPEASEGETLSLDSESEGDPTTQEIVIWHGLDDQETLALGQIVANFLHEHPGIQVSLTYIPFDDLQGRFLKAVANGTGPDIMLGAGEWGPQLYDLDAVASIPKVILDELSLELTPAARQAVDYQDTLIAIPYVIEGIVLFRNAAILPIPSQTFEEMVASSQKVTKAGTVGAYLERGDNFASAQLTACNGILLFPNGFPAFNNAAGLCWLNLLSLFEAAGPVSFNSDDDLNRFKTGNVGLIFAGTWHIAALQDAIGDNLVIDSWPAFGDSHLSGYVWTENIYLNSNLTEERFGNALVFTKHFLNPQGQSIFAEIGKIPATLYRDVREPLIFQAMAALVRGTPYPVLPEMEVYRGPLHEALVAVFEGNLAPSEALQRAEDEITAKIEEFTDKGEDF